MFAVPIIFYIVIEQRTLKPDTGKSTVILSNWTQLYNGIVFNTMSYFTHALNVLSRTQYLEEISRWDTESNSFYVLTSGYHIDDFTKRRKILLNCQK